MKLAFLRTPMVSNEGRGATPAGDADGARLFARLVDRATQAASCVQIAPGWVVACVPGRPVTGGDYGDPLRRRFTAVAADGRRATIEANAMVVTSDVGPSTIALIPVPEGTRDVIILREGDSAVDDLVARGAWHDFPRKGVTAHEFIGSFLQDVDARFVTRFLVRSAIAAQADDAAAVLRFGLPQVLMQVDDCHKPYGFGCYVDELIAFAGRGYLLRGWRYDPDNLIASVEIVPPSGVALPVPFDQCRFERDDVLQHYDVKDVSRVGQRPGFVAFVEDRAAVESRVDDIVVRMHGGYPSTIMTAQNRMTPAEKRSRLLNCTDPRDILSMEALSPAFDAAQAEVVAQTQIALVRDYNRPAARPRFSLIVPLYLRYDFIRYQLAAFANDPDFSDVEIIYVLDSPHQQRDFLELLGFWTQLWGLSIRTVVMAANVGYAAATNAGVSVAVGDLVVLLNSDVFPAGAGWLTTMSRALDEVPGVGLVGPRLLYEDGTLQHAGMYYTVDALGMWSNHHHFKGYPADYPGANESRYVAAVTGACVMLQRDLLLALGGLAEDYCVGDFEDSDLCNKAAAAGYRSWYEAGATLYHLERQSFSLSTYNHLGWRYNQWLHERRWRDRVSEAGAQLVQR